MDLGLRGKVAAIGGASKGIGRATAFAFAREGAKVAICARGEEALERTRKELEAEGAEVYAARCDMASYDDIKRFIKGTVDRFGRLDIVVNNAGGPPYGTFETHDEAAWLAAVDQNFLSAVRTTREALPYLRQAGSGRVINITSTAVKQPIDGLILSNATRMAVAGLAKTLSRELAKDNILVNTVCPGSTLTDRVTQLYEKQAVAEGRTVAELLEANAREVPLGRIGQPEDVAALIVFLAGEPAKHITGTTIQVDGGETTAVF